MSRRSIAGFFLTLAPLSVASAQIIGPPPCTPCSGPGGCAASDPIVSGVTHKCENHGGHSHPGQSWTGNDMRQIMFSSGNLTGTQFTDCKLTKANMYNVDLTGGAIVDCQARDGLYIDATLANCDMSGTNFSNARFTRADLTGSMLLADFGGARLDDADLTAATLSSGPDMANFSDADLSGADGLQNTVGVAMYSACTDFSGTGFDPVAAGWVLVGGGTLGANYCTANNNSTGGPASIGASGCIDASANAFSLEAVDLPMNQNGYFLASQTQDFIANPGGSAGNLCVGGTVGRFVNDVKNSGMAGAFSIDVDLNDLPPPLTSVAPGETWNFTAWYRDAATSNFTDGVSVTFE